MDSTFTKAVLFSLFPTH
uniref:Uncharacterized protein n=1 Tax=Arundo donax TaxID=35708 RepID=A0A0A9GWS6_ARUDO